ncbi:MAG: hypothetical protein IPM39_27010 [Chloroflexi bacterium]|nr:hypothetical protein [Chloroflexota bacterium]
MRFVPLLIFLVIAGLALPVLIAAECSDQAISVSEAGDYNLFEQIDFDEELIMPNVGGWISRLNASKASWMQVRRQSHFLLPVPPPPKYA